MVLWLLYLPLDRQSNSRLLLGAAQEKCITLKTEYRSEAQQSLAQQPNPNCRPETRKISFGKAKTKSCPCCCLNRSWLREDASSAMAMATATFAIAVFSCSFGQNFVAAGAGRNNLLLPSFDFASCTQ